MSRLSRLASSWLNDSARRSAACSATCSGSTASRLYALCWYRSRRRTTRPIWRNRLKLMMPLGRRGCDDDSTYTISSTSSCSDGTQGGAHSVARSAAKSRSTYELALATIAPVSATESRDKLDCNRVTAECASPSVTAHTTAHDRSSTAPAASAAASWYAAARSAAVSGDTTSCTTHWLMHRVQLRKAATVESRLLRLSTVNRSRWRTLVSSAADRIVSCLASSRDGTSVHDAGGFGDEYNGAGGLDDDREMTEPAPPPGT
mmetsp:Transcript_12516/g.39555  ORF Transcript_12516/g.39555 Transcript_12516/m.39555 type:complete len:261 (+) Transcript_12516:1489-2271(+)